MTTTKEKDRERGRSRKKDCFNLFPTLRSLSLSPALPRSADSTGASRSDDDRVCDIFQHKNEHLHRVIKMKALLLTNNAIVSFPLSPTLYLSVYFFFYSRWCEWIKLNKLPRFCNGLALFFRAARSPDSSAATASGGYVKAVAFIKFLFSTPFAGLEPRSFAIAAQVSTIR